MTNSTVLPRAGARSSNGLDDLPHQPEIQQRLAALELDLDRRRRRRQRNLDGAHRRLLAHVEAVAVGASPRNLAIRAGMLAPQGHDEEVQRRRLRAGKPSGCAAAAPEAARARAAPCRPISSFSKARSYSPSPGATVQRAMRSSSCPVEQQQVPDEIRDQANRSPPSRSNRSGRSWSSDARPRRNAAAAWKPRHAGLTPAPTRPAWPRGAEGQRQDHVPHPLGLRRHFFPEVLVGHQVEETAPQQRLVRRPRPRSSLFRRQTAAIPLAVDVRSGMTRRRISR